MSGSAEAKGAGRLRILTPPPPPEEIRQKLLLPGFFLVSSGFLPVGGQDPGPVGVGIGWRGGGKSEDAFLKKFLPDASGKNTGKNRVSSGGREKTSVFFREQDKNTIVSSRGEGASEAQEQRGGHDGVLAGGSEAHLPWCDRYLKRNFMGGNEN